MMILTSQLSISSDEDFFNSKTPALEKGALRFKSKKRDSGDSPNVLPVKHYSYRQPKMPRTPPLYNKNDEELNSEDWEKEVEAKHNKSKTHYKNFK